LYRETIVEAKDGKIIRRRTIIGTSKDKYEYENQKSINGVGSSAHDELLVESSKENEYNR
jgi:hypothetical protein